MHQLADGGGMWLLKIIFWCRLRIAADREAERMNLLRIIYDNACETMGERRAAALLAKELAKVGRARDARQIIKERRAKEEARREQSR
jgi:hypothetical protein